MIKKQTKFIIILIFPYHIKYSEMITPYQLWQCLLPLVLVEAIMQNNLSKYLNLQSTKIYQLICRCPPNDHNQIYLSIQIYITKLSNIVQKQFKMEQYIQTIGKNFKIVGKIDQGAFGQIYQGINTITNLQVAIKVQRADTDSPQIFDEFKLYNHLHNDPDVIDKGIPNAYYCNKQGGYNVLVMDLMGPSLEALFDQTLRKFSLKTVLMLIDQMISRIQYIHKRRFIHRDIKPDNFCIGRNKTSHKIFLIDFGLANKYLHKNREHIVYREGKCLTGTARYASINTHLGIEQSRRDDMQSIGYVAMYFLRGMLPWQGLKAGSKQQKYKKIKQKKLATSIEMLCKGYPSQFTSYLTQCRNLKFDEKPPYEAFRAMFKQLFNSNGYKFDYQYDWVILQQKRQKFQKRQFKTKQQV